MIKCLHNDTKYTLKVKGICFCIFVFLCLHKSNVYGTKLKAQRLLNQTSAVCLVFFTVNKWKSTVINKKNIQFIVAFKWLYNEKSNKSYIEFIKYMS